MRQRELMIYPFKTSLGADPELFLSDGGTIIGSERVISAGTQKRFCSVTSSSAAVVRDGVQVELQPEASYCREILIANISYAFKQLRDHLSGSIAPDFSPVVEVTKRELDSLSEASRRLGCAPSRNSHNPEASISVDPMTYAKRSAGGHIHIGLNDQLIDLMGVREKMVPILDILVGNTCVMLEDGGQAAERRKVYGRAGEYRLPRYGLEYRTLSNFWLKSPVVASFVLGLVRLAINVVGTQVVSEGKNNLPTHWHYSDSGRYGTIQMSSPHIMRDLLECVDILDIVRAINTGDQDLARANWLALRPWFEKYTPEPLWTGDFPNSVTSDTFDFVTFFLSKPLDFWFPEDPFQAWLKVDPSEHFGWERFLLFVVRNIHSIALKQEAA